MTLAITEFHVPSSYIGIISFNRHDSSVKVTHLHFTHEEVQRAQHSDSKSSALTYEYVLLGQNRNIIEKTIILFGHLTSYPRSLPNSHWYQFGVHPSGSFCSCIYIYVCIHSDYPIDLSSS